MALKRHSGIRLIGSLLTTLFTLGGSFVVTYAWFTTNRAVQADASDLTIRRLSDAVKTVTLHSQKQVDPALSLYSNPFQYEKDAYATYVPDPNSDEGTWTYASASDEGMALSIPAYSDELPYSSALILIELRDGLTQADYESLKVVFSTTTTAEESLVYMSDNKVQNPIQAEDNALSSIISFSACSYAGLDAETENSGLVFPAADFPTSSSFLTLAKDESSFDYATSLSLISAPAEGTKYIAIVPQYNAETINYIYTLNLGSAVLDSASSIGFSCDFTLKV